MSRPIEVLIPESSLDIHTESVKDCILSMDALATYRVPDGSLEVAFVDEKTCRQLHGDFFNDTDVTDVMTFPGDRADGHAGDVAICPAVAAQRCRIEGTSFPEELTLYLVHAWLHLAGLDDGDAESVAAMRKAETHVMEHLKEQSRLLQANWLT